MLQKKLPQLTSTHSENIETFVDETNMHYPKHKELANIQLNQRETDIIRWYLLGKSVSQTAQILGLSHHTVHTYFDRLKKKMGCHFKPQLLLKLIDGEFIGPDDWRDIY